MNLPRNRHLKLLKLIIPMLKEGISTANSLNEDVQFYEGYTTQEEHPSLLILPTTNPLFLSPSESEAIPRSHGRSP